MKTLEMALRDYLALQRAVGFKYREAERCLKHFVSSMNQRGACRITSQLAYEWATESAQATPAHWAQRLGYVRRFARYMQVDHPDTEVPSAQLIRARNARAKPYLYSHEEITRLMAAAKALSPGNRLPGLSYHYLFGLLAATGLRVSEALALTHENVDLDHGILTVRAAKFGKSRLVPLHRSTQRALKDYARQRDALIGEPRSPYFLVAGGGGRLWGQRCASPSTRFRDRPDCVGRAIVTDRACTTCVIDSQSRRCVAGIGAARTSRLYCHLSARTWAMSTSRTRIGTSPLAQSC